MTERIYYFDNNTEGLSTRLQVLAMLIPCFVKKEYIEMNWCKVTILARIQDVATVEKFLADLA